MFNGLTRTRPSRPARRGAPGRRRTLRRAWRNSAHGRTRWRFRRLCIEDRIQNSDPHVFACWPAHASVLHRNWQSSAGPHERRGARGRSDRRQAHCYHPEHHHLPRSSTSNWRGFLNRAMPWTTKNAKKGCTASARRSSITPDSSSQRFQFPGPDSATNVRRRSRQDREGEAAFLPYFDHSRLRTLKPSDFRPGGAPPPLRRRAAVVFIASKRSHHRIPTPKNS